MGAGVLVEGLSGKKQRERTDGELMAVDSSEGIVGEGRWKKTSRG